VLEDDDEDDEVDLFSLGEFVKEEILPTQEL
jgi:hypothetical protein